MLPSFKQPGATARRLDTHVNRPLAAFADHAWSALVNVPVDSDGLVRRYPCGEKLDGEFTPSMGAVLAGRLDSAGAPFLIDFGIRAASVPVVSYLDVLRGDRARSAG